MNESPKKTSDGYMPAVHRIACLFAIIVFPLIWIGGLVTSFDAGMAVPDWPNTYGYNLFLYPIDSWVFGPWDLFVEHGHRLLASLAGLVAIVMVIFAWRYDRRVWFRNLAMIAFGLVVVQGVLGGLRVVLDQRTLAMLHGCLGPTFFMFVVALWAGSSKWWFQVSRLDGDAAIGRAATGLFWAAALILLLSWVQLIIGANMRHHSINADPLAFRSLVMTHLTLAMAILIGSCLVGQACFRRDLKATGIRRLGVALIVCVIAQIGLGLATWVVKFGWPFWLDGYVFASSYVIGEKSFLQMNIVTGHVAVGSLVLALLTAITLRGLRLAVQGHAVAPAPSGLGVAQ